MNTVKAAIKGKREVAVGPASGLRRLSRVIVAVYVVGTLTFRSRTSTQLAAQAVDTAAAFRLLANSLVIGLCLAGLLHEGLSRARRKPAPQPAARAYLPYIALVCVSAYSAVSPGLVFFRAFDLATAVLAAYCAARWSNFRERLDLVRTILLTFALLLAISVLLYPRESLDTAGGLLPFRAQGVFPSQPYNGLGTTGALLFALALPLHGSRRRWHMCIGLALVLLTQYRTGYIAVLLTLLVWLIASRGALAKVASLLLVPAAYLATTTSLFALAWTRGEVASRSAETLSGRTEFWSRALDVVERSPVIGTGLSSGVRYEVLPGLGRESTSTIHSTWVEVFVGTGYLGLAAMLMLVLTAFACAWKLRTLSLAPLLILVVLITRSLTGTTFELANVTVIYALLALAPATSKSGALSYALVEPLEQIRQPARGPTLRRFPRSPQRVAQG